MNTKKVCSAIVFSMSFAAVAEVAVIVHPSNSNALDQSAIGKIFTGKAKSFDSGDQAIAINQSVDAAATEEFNSKVLNKSATQLKAYWSKLIFTGKGSPPKEVDTDAEVIELVAANPNIIGYVSADAANDSVKVVAVF